MADAPAAPHHGPLSGDVTIPGTHGKKVPKALAIGGVAVVGVLAAVWWRNNHSATGTSTGAAATVTDSAGNVCSAVNPATGFCPGTAEDTNALNGTLNGAGGFGDGSGGDSIIGTTTPDQVTNGPPFTTNAAWSQYAVATLEASDSAIDTGALTDALGAYLNGGQVTAAQHVLINDALAVAGSPPVTGANGFPPSINVAGSISGGGTGTTVVKVRVPNVVGMRTAEQAEPAIKAAGLVPSLGGGFDAHAVNYVNSQTPAANTLVNQGSTVRLGSSRTAPKK
jgi:hypothetical protein